MDSIQDSCSEMRGLYILHFTPRHARSLPQGLAQSFITDRQSDRVSVSSILPSVQWAFFPSSIPVQFDMTTKRLMKKILARPVFRPVNPPVQ
jgi:hypothetical protein